jgi:hypothetical protein
MKLKRSRQLTQKNYLASKLLPVFLLPRASAEAMAQAPGDLLEWLKRHAWKVCIRETVSRVRIPQSPHSLVHLLLSNYPFYFFPV